MLRTALSFERRPNSRPDAAGSADFKRDEVRLMVSTPEGTHTVSSGWTSTCGQATCWWSTGATIPASLPATAALGVSAEPSTCYGGGLWLAEPRWSAGRPGPLPLERGGTIAVAGTQATTVGPHPGLPRLWFVRLDAAVERLMWRMGSPSATAMWIPLTRSPCTRPSLRQAGSAEMPSAGLALHAGACSNGWRRVAWSSRASSCTRASPAWRWKTERVEEHRCTPSRSRCRPRRRARSTRRSRAARHRRWGRRWSARWRRRGMAARMRPAQGFTRIFIHPDRGVQTVDRLISGFHDPLASHLAMLYAVVGEESVRSAYAVAVRQRYLWHASLATAICYCGADRVRSVND